MSKKIILGDKIFNSKLEAKNFISEFIKLNEGIINKEEYFWIIELFKRHEYFKDKLEDIKEIIIKETDRNNKCFHIVKNNNEIEPISYLKCLNSENEKQNINKALRDDIEEQINEFRKIHLKKESQCYFCNIILIDNKTTHIDHEIKFRDLVNNFLLIEPNIETKSIAYRRTISDENIRNKWKQFHKEKAKLRLLCSKCNLKNH